MSRTFLRGAPAASENDGNERVAYERPRALPGVEVPIAEQSGRRWRVFHEMYAVCSILRSPGTAEWAYRGKIHESRAGDQMLFEPGEVHVNTRALLAADFRALFLPAVVMEAAATELGVPHRHPHFAVADVSDPQLFAAFARLHESLETGTTDLERQTRYTAALRLLLERYAERGPASPSAPARTALVRAREYIDARYAESITLGDIAAAAGVSRFHLARAFAREFGLPPHAYRAR